MRSLVLLMLVVLSACGESAASKDAATADGAIVILPPGLLDASDCSYGWTRNWPTDAAACFPVEGKGLIYDLKIGLDAGDCSGRPPMACDGACGPASTLDDQVRHRVQGCLHMESMFAVTFSQGCADRLYLDAYYYRPDELATCMADALANVRFACAEQAPCWQWSASTLLPLAP